MAVWTQRRELTTKFPSWQWRYITCICGQNEGRKLRPQRDSITSALFSFVFLLTFPIFSIGTDSSSVTLRLESLRQGVRNRSSSPSFLPHLNQNLLAELNGKGKALADTYPLRPHLPHQPYQTGDCTWTNEELHLQLQAGFLLSDMFWGGCRLPLFLSKLFP